jgi:hypothetical protein
MTEVTGFLVILLPKLPEEKKLAINNDVIDSLHKTFPSSGPVKFTGALILGTGTSLINKDRDRSGSSNMRATISNRIVLGIMLNIICLRDTLINQKTLKLTNSSNNKESILRTVIGARTTEPIPMAINN